MKKVLTEQDLSNLDKQTLIDLLMATQASIRSLEKTIENNNQVIGLLTEEVANLRQHRFGRSSEQRLTDQIDGQMSFAFNEAEKGADTSPSPAEPEIEEVVSSYTRKKAKGKREDDLKDIPTTIATHDLSDDQLREYFPDGKWKRLPDEVYKRLEFHPITFEVVEHHVAVYVGYDNQTFVRADRPVSLLRNSVLTPSLGAGIINWKYVNSMPITRLSKEFERQDVHISSQNMCNWTIQVADRYIRRVYDRLKTKLSGYHVIHADETPVEVNRDGRPAGSKSYMWVYRSGSLEHHPFALYDFHTGRKKEYAQKFLADFHGICVTDGYEVYHSIGRERKDITIAGCWSHGRRRFADAVKAIGKEAAKGTVACQALEQIGTIFHLEDTYKDLSAEDRLARRKTIIAPLVDAFFAYIKNERKRISPKSITGKAIDYCIDQESYLRVFLTDGLVPLHNNAAEQAIRSFCVGKHNWYVIDTIRGAEASAMLYSITETAKMNGLKPYEYVKFLLEEIPRHGEFEDPVYLDDLLPWSDSLPDICRKTKAGEKA